MLEADDPGGAELCSLAPVDWSASLAGMALFSAEFVLPAAEFGPAELCSAAPPDVSALPDGGTVASFEASDDTPGPVGCFPEFLSSKRWRKAEQQCDCSRCQKTIYGYPPFRRAKQTQISSTSRCGS